MDMYLPRSCVKYWGHQQAGHITRNGKSYQIRHRDLTQGFYRGAKETLEDFVGNPMTVRFRIRRPHLNGLYSTPSEEMSKRSRAIFSYHCCQHRKEIHRPVPSSSAMQEHENGNKNKKAGPETAYLFPKCKASGWKRTVPQPNIKNI